MAFGTPDFGRTRVVTLLQLAPPIAPEGVAFGGRTMRTRITTGYTCCRHAATISLSERRRLIKICHAARLDTAWMGARPTGLGIQLDSIPGRIAREGPPLMPGGREVRRTNVKRISNRCCMHSIFF
jgi:hypothetical protein